MNERILIVDDDESVRWVLKKALEKDGLEAVLAKDAAEAFLRLQDGDIAVVLMDIRMPGMSGLDALEKVRKEGRNVSVIIMTAQATMQNAIEAMRRGAYDYITKPFDLDEVTILVKKALDVRHLSQEVDTLRAEVREKYEEGLVGGTSAMQEIYKTIGRVAESDATVLIHGESGTGKELVARAIHYHSKRAGRPFVAVNSAAIPSELLESELFGHEKGAFTGAVARKMGKFEAAAGGTLFLDEIGDLPLALQPKLLRFLQDQEYERLGDPSTRKADVRIITATNRDLEGEVKVGRFREDLFYRLNVIQIEIPPLRERPQDLEALATQLLAFYGRIHHRSFSGFTEEATQMMKRHAWPGNLRELRNVIERASILCRSERIDAEYLPGPFSRGEATPAVGNLVSLEKIEEEHIRRVLASTGSLQEAARILGIDQATLWRRRKQYGI